MKKKQTLVELKMRKAELRNQMDEELRQFGCFRGDTLDEYYDVVASLSYVEKRLLKPIVVSVFLAILFLSGCTSSAGFGVSSSVYYPKKHESPASRKQHTQPTVGMARNNLPMVGGAK